MGFSIGVGCLSENAHNNLCIIPCYDTSYRNQLRYIPLLAAACVTMCDSIYHTFLCIFAQQSYTKYTVWGICCSGRNN